MHHMAFLVMQNKQCKHRKRAAGLLQKRRPAEELLHNPPLKKDAVSRS